MTAKTSNFQTNNESADSTESKKSKRGVSSPESSSSNGKQEPSNQEKSENLESQLEAMKSEIESLKKELEETKNRYYRALADYDNLKRRTDQKLLEMSEYASEAFVKKLLPVLDTFDSAMRQLSDAKVEPKIMDGFEMLFFQLNDVLEKEGLKAIAAKGEKFDPNLHEAVMRRTDPNQEDGIILEVYEKGYMFKKRVLRTAKVVINHKP